MASSKSTAQMPVKAHLHKDKRVNIPTEELRDFVAEDEQAHKSVLYPRDPALDPQLVWQGKDQQDRYDLAIPVVPIYIQEKIHPQAIIDGLPRAAQSGEAQLDLFADFNGLPVEFDQRVDFYHHEGHWSNRMILGDSLLVMTSLAEKEGLKGKVQCIYLDPPYGIKFGSNWQVSTRKRDVRDGRAEDVTRQPEQVRAFRDTWQLGIHSYLAYLRDRLVTARELLTETGSVFVQISDENVHLVRCVLDEVFGADNFAGFITYRVKSPLNVSGLGRLADYILWYTKDNRHMKYRQLFTAKNADEQQEFNMIELDTGERMTVAVARQRFGDVPITARRLTAQNLASSGYTVSCTFDFQLNGHTFVSPGGKSWKTTRDGMRRLAWAGRLVPLRTSLRYAYFLDDFPVQEISNVWTDTFAEPDKEYVVQTSEQVIERCLLMTTDPGDLVLDPTCGSGTTAYVAEQWGRRWITCDTSRVALALARTRLMAAKFPYYLLADSAEGRKKEAEVNGNGTALTPGPSPAAEYSGGRGETTALTPGRPHPSPLPEGTPSPLGPLPEGEGDIRKGFVYKRVPHVTLKSIANNPDIKEGMTRAEIDAAIARHAESETLYDQPYEDKKTVRVSGPFTVESLSPHRTISAEEKIERATVGRDGLKMRVIGPDNFATMILDNLKKAGVQNTIKGERLKFDSLEPFAGEWIHAEGWYMERPLPSPLPKGEGTKHPHHKPLPEGEGTRRRAAVCIGPEHGTVGTVLIKEAAKEAVRGVGFDVLLVCGFAFDPSVSEEAKRYGKLTVLPVRMNPDLAMGDELLKKTGAGNLFMVFGEPDVEIRHLPSPSGRGAGGEGGKITVLIKGLDVYDPTTGQIRNSSTDDIACWFIDTNYNGESFFVRHAYFTGAEEPYDKLKRALRAEIDEAAWSALYSTTSRPFDRPETGKIAVKVINHYGDEVLKVFEVVD